MHGNVWEWCRDWLQRSLGSGAATDPNGASSGASRVYRGGSWDCDALRCRSAERDCGVPSGAMDYLGLRPSMVLPEDE